MSTEPDLEQRLRAAAPKPGRPPDVTELWRRSQGVRWSRYAGGAALVGLLATGLVGAVALRPTVELAPGASPGERAAAFDEERYCAEAESFLGAVASNADEPEAPAAAPAEDFDFRASHEALTDEFSQAAAAAPPELAEAWEAVQADLAAQGEVWASIDWDPERAGGWPDVLRQLNSLPTSAAASSAMETLTTDYAHRCLGG